MGQTKMQDNVERWLVHEGLSFKYFAKPENLFYVRAEIYGISVEIFEPKAQPGILVVGSMVTMKNKQMARYSAFNDNEKREFERRVGDFCRSISAVNKNVTEDGKYKIGVYVVMDDKSNINQQAVFDAIDRVAQMHEKVTMFLLKTF